MTASRGTKRKPSSRLRRFVDALPLSLSYTILASTWIGFVFFISVKEVLLRRHQLWRFVEQQIIYNTLCILAVLSLFSASTQQAGSPDPTLDPERDLDVPKLLPAPNSLLASEGDEDDIPLKFLRNSEWIHTRKGKDRPSPLPLPAHRIEEEQGCPSQHSASLAEPADSPFPFAASPFVPATVEETGEDTEAETSGGIYRRSSSDHLDQEHKADAIDTDHLLPSSAVSSGRRSVMAKSNDGTPRWCKKCDTWKPDRSHHCRFCQTCILKMDHHCVWIGTCVGYRNYKPFLLFVTYSSILSLYGSIESGYETFRFFEDPEAFYPNTPLCPTGQECVQVPQSFDLGPIFFMLLAVLGGFFALAVGSLAGYHWWLACNNISTIENLTHAFPSVLLADLSPPGGGDTSARWTPDHLLTREERVRLRREARHINVYDLGWKKNLAQIFGKGTLLSSLWPLSRPAANYETDAGHFYPVDEEKLEGLKRLTRELRFRDNASNGSARTFVVDDESDNESDLNGEPLHSAQSSSKRS
ncbi:DHHC palmitoyltransferase-domain-containing protein [Kockovaella imperatae]|uniref:Palmitoyltransferase n=1 Tax=Kockovaella imperatae TaxID=4999 RepID=A0A1Y1U8U4_9TREE|nr:DHHC palmitoyltransferase-domain-containing protein [Kockovaella imperatae]ORX34461.1 DHHC palmitoyltransferase-domain-containing protein [Kockovaella imperatae]